MNVKIIAVEDRCAYCGDKRKYLVRLETWRFVKYLAVCKDCYNVLVRDFQEPFGAGLKKK